MSARIINAVLSGLPKYRRVHVPDVDRIDRPSLKVMARAMLLLKPSDRFCWIWHSTADPLAAQTDCTDNFFVSSRGHFLRQLVSIISPEIQRNGQMHPLSQPESDRASITAWKVGEALVLQNYDACFLWGGSLVDHGDDTTAAEGLRLMAIAAVNTGKYVDALQKLELAEQICHHPAKRAHLCYLQGLVEVKRVYDLSTSAAYYQRGLDVLRQSGPGAEDLALERGWLLNGLALNETIEWRRNPKEHQHYQRAFDLEREALELVLEGEDPSRIYLRFNLLANLAFLLEIRGHYDAAINLFKEAFDFGMEELPPKKFRWRSTLGYRIGLLHYRAGRLAESSRDLNIAIEQDNTIENWPTRERILRALGVVELKRGNFAQAGDLFSEGLELCSNSRSAEGAEEHARGLIAACLARGDRSRATEIWKLLADEEGLVLCPKDRLACDPGQDGIGPSAPSPKLPAYFPEIDLEGIPAIDLNRYLGRAETQGIPVELPGNAR